MNFNPSRFSTVSRRAFVAGASAAAILGVAGCTNDKAVLGSSGATGTSSKATAAGTSASAAASGAAGGAVPASAKAALSFTYAAADGGGRVRNPYIAVWAENSSGKLVRTISLWHLQDNDRWLNELSKWYQVSEGEEAGSSATRAPGSYSVSWDLTDLNGARVTAGSYYLCVESAREHGSHSLVREQVTLGAQGLAKNLSANGELSAVKLAYTV